MANLDDFIEYYKTISDTELLAILNAPGEYQPLAIEAAKKELAKRKLSDTQIQKAMHPLIVKQEQEERERKKVKAVEDKVRKVGHAFFESINPIQSGIPSNEKAIRLIVIIFTGIVIYHFISDFGTHWATIKDIPRFPIESIMYFLPLTLLPIATITFWKKRAVGWILLTIFLAYSVVVVFWLLFQSFSWKPSGLNGLDNLFPRPSPSSYIFQLIFLVGTICVLGRENMRRLFSISKQKMTRTITITSIVTFVLMCVIYW